MSFFHSLLTSVSSSQYTSELQAVINRAITLGYTLPSSATLNAINTFILARKADGSWVKFDVFYITALNNSALSNFASLNYITPASFQLSYVNSPSYLATGVKGDGLSSYADTNFTPSTNGINYTLNAAARGTYLYAIPTLGVVLDGNSTAPIVDNFIYGSSNASRVNTTNILSSTVAISGVGYKSINRQDSTNLNVYNGLTANARTATSTALSAFSIVLGKRTTSFSDALISMYFLGGSLSSTQHNNISNNFSSYLTTIGL
jgi:hypothetical protein